MDGYALSMRFVLRVAYCVFEGILTKYAVSNPFNP